MYITRRILDITNPTKRDTKMSILLKNTASTQLRSTSAILLNQTRYGHTMRGKPPGVARSLEQRLSAESTEDKLSSGPVNIGFPQLRPSRSEQLKLRLEHFKSQRAQNRSNKLLIDVNSIQQAHVKTNGPHDLRIIANHYGIFRDLFDSAFFVPRVPLDIKYALEANITSTVFNGNVIKPAEANKTPLVQFNGRIDPITGKLAAHESYWTLVATNPDAHIDQKDSECLHWLITNIPNGDVKAGEVLVDYLPPFPPKGAGYQRFVFVLYKQNEKLDLNALKITSSDFSNLKKRSFNTLSFYRQHQDKITPAGLAFYQTIWDQSVTKFYHTVLNKKEPTYEYDFPKAYLADQKFFPLKQPFNLYMDKHRDAKQVNKEYLQRKLATTHPFDGPEPALRFPNAHAIRGVPSWLKTEIKKQRLQCGRVQDY